VIYLGEAFIGKQFSMPSVSDCESLGRNHMPKTTPEVTARTQKYGRRAAIALSTCERCGSPFSGLSALCVPCKERKR
jgi:ribosomal protein L32